jgi:hypothetical protein
MIRWALLLGLVVALPGAAADDEPAESGEPIRLKKKSRPDTEQPAARPEPAEPPAPPSDAGSDRETLTRLYRNLRASQDRLGQRDVGDATQQIQRDIVRDLQALVEQTRRQQQANPPSGSSEVPPMDSAGSTEPRPAPGSEPARPGPNPMGQADRGPGTADPATAASARPQLSRLAELYKEVWGHLPEALRLEMDAYSRERFMARYRDVLEQYYTTIAEKGRRQEMEP